MLGGCSLLYSAALYASSLQADLFELANPWWILTSATILLLSPLYHAIIIPAIARARGLSTSSNLGETLERFVPLFLGQVLVNLGVILGSMLLVVPGIFVGLRTIYYKQAVILHGATVREAILSSLQRTGAGKRLVEIFLVLGVLYCVPLGMEFFVLAALPLALRHVVAVFGTALFISWANAFVTDSYLQTAARETEPTVL